MLHVDRCYPPQTVLTWDTALFAPASLRLGHFVTLRVQPRLKPSLVCCLCSVCGRQSQWSHAHTQPSSSDLPGGLADASGWALEQSCQLPPVPAGSAIPRLHLGLDVTGALYLAGATYGWCRWRWLLVNKSVCSVSPHTISKFIHISITLHLNYSTTVCLEPTSFQGHPVLLRTLPQRHFKSVFL